MNKHKHQDWTEIGSAKIKGEYLSFICSCGVECRVPYGKDENGQIKGKFLRKMIETGKVKIYEQSIT